MIFNIRVLTFTLAVVMPLVANTVRAESEVNVYSFRQSFLIKPLLDTFTKETGIKVNVVFAEKGLVERLQQEGRNSPADLLLTVDIGRIMDAVDGGVTQPIQSAQLESNIPAQFRDPSGQWYGLTTRARVIVTSKERVPKDAVKRYEDLADPQWKGRVCTRSGKHVYNTALIASMIVHHGAAGGEQWLTGLKNNLARKPQGGDIDQVKAIQAGECDIALINHYYLGVMLKDSKLAAAAQTVNLIFPNQDERGTHVNISGIALTQSAPHKDNALKLMGFLSGDEAQRLYAELNSEFPVKPGVPWSDILKTWGEFKIDPLPLAEIAAHRKEAIELVDKVRYDD